MQLLVLLLVAEDDLLFAPLCRKLAQKRNEHSSGFDALGEALGWSIGGGRAEVGRHPPSMRSIRPCRRIGNSVPSLFWEGRCLPGLSQPADLDCYSTAWTKP